MKVYELKLTATATVTTTIVVALADDEEPNDLGEIMDEASISIGTVLDDWDWEIEGVEEDFDVDEVVDLSDEDEDEDEDELPDIAWKSPAAAELSDQVAAERAAHKSTPALIEVDE